MAEEANDGNAESSPVVEDVNTEAPESSPVVEDNDTVEVPTFGGQQNDIPYERFKEVNAAKKEAERELKGLRADMDRKVQDEVIRQEAQIRRDYESKLATTQPVNDVGYDDYESGLTEESADVKALKAQVEELTATVGKTTSKLQRQELKREIKILAKEYPALQEEHVMAIAKIRPNWSWEECAEYSHNTMNDHLKAKWSEMVNTKKVAAKKKVIGGEGLRNMKPEDKPKSFAEAAARAAEYLGGND